MNTALLLIRVTRRFTNYWNSFKKNLCPRSSNITPQSSSTKHRYVSVECLSKCWPLRLCPVTLSSFPTPVVLLCYRHVRGVRMGRLLVLCTSNLRRSLQTKETPSLFSTDTYEGVPKNNGNCDIARARFVVMYCVARHCYLGVSRAILPSEVILCGVVRPWCCFVFLLSTSSDYCDGWPQETKKFVRVSPRLFPGHNLCKNEWDH
jgi:hypothetical protein